MPDEVALLQAALAEQELTAPSVQTVYDAARPRLRRRRALREGGLLLAAAAGAALLVPLLPGPAGEGELAAGPELGRVDVPANVQRALTGYDTPTGHRPGDPVELLARVELGGGRYLATVVPAEHRSACRLTFVGPEGDSIAGGCGGGDRRPAPGSLSVSASAVGTDAWLSGSAPRGTTTVTCTDPGGAVTARAHDGGDELGAAHFLVALPRERLDQPRSCTAFDAIGAVTGSLPAPAGTPPS